MEEREEFPEAAYRLLGKTGLLTLPFPEQYGGGGAALRGLPPGARGDRHRLAERGGRCQRARAHRDGRRGQRHRGAEGRVAAPDAQRRLARRLLPERAAGRLRRQRHPDQGGARRRRVRHHRHQAVDQQRLVRRLLHPVRPHERRPEARPVGVHRPGRHARHELRPAREEARPALRHHHAGDVRRRPDPGGQPDRRRGRRHARRALRARRRPARHRGRRDRHRPGGPGPRRRATPASASSSASRSGSSRACSSCSPTWPPPWSAAGRRTSMRRGSRTPACRSTGWPASPS